LSCSLMYKPLFSEIICLNNRKSALFMSYSITKEMTEGIKSAIILKICMRRI